MSVFEIDPVNDPRWADFIGRHRQASVFHSPGWLMALQKTYGYQPFALTTAAEGEPLGDGILLCRVNSWLTGRRAVSLPFSDHCQPLAAGDRLHFLLESLRRLHRREAWKYLELRPILARFAGQSLLPGERFHWHRLSLEQSLDAIQKGFHKTAVRQMIRRAEREGLTYEESAGPELLQRFYRLLVLTRKRHQLPPPPLKWFSNLMDALKGSATIRLASKQGSPVAAILILAHPRSWVYKYGCSDSRHHKLGGISMLLWKTVQDAFQEGAEEIDFGRSDMANQGLVTFKERWGAVGTSMRYYRHPEAAAQLGAAPAPAMRLARQVFAGLPPGALKAMGRCLYRHIG